MTTGPPIWKEASRLVVYVCAVTRDLSGVVMFLLRAGEYVKGKKVIVFNAVSSDQFIFVCRVSGTRGYYFVCGRCSLYRRKCMLSLTRHCFHTLIL